MAMVPMETQPCPAAAPGPPRSMSVPPGGSGSGLAGKASSAKASLSDKWAVISTPKALRHTKEVIMGKEKMHNDPLEPVNVEIVEYDGLLKALNATTATLQGAISMLTGAPQSLHDLLQRFYGTDQPGIDTQLVSRLSAALQGFTNQTQQATPHMEELNKLIMEMSEKSAEIHKQINTRTKAWENMNHYESKVITLREQVAKTPTNQKLLEKLNRNEAKKLEGEQDYNQKTEETLKAAGEMLNSKWSKMDAVLSKFCLYYVANFEACSALIRELTVVGEQFAGKSATNAWMQKANTLAGSAVDRFASIAALTRDKAHQSTVSAQQVFGSTSQPMNPWGAGAAQQPPASTPWGSSQAPPGPPGSPAQPWGPQPPNSMPNMMPPTGASATPWGQQPPAHGQQPPWASVPPTGGPPPGQQTPPWPGAASMPPTAMPPAAAPAPAPAGAPAGGGGGGYKQGDPVEYWNGSTWTPGTVTQVSWRRVRIELPGDSKTGSKVKWVDEKSNEVRKSAAAAYGGMPCQDPSAGACQWGSCPQQQQWAAPAQTPWA